MTRPSLKTELRELRWMNEHKEKVLKKIYGFESIDPQVLPKQKYAIVAFAAIACCSANLPGSGYTGWLLLITFCYGYNAWSIPLRATMPHLHRADNIAPWMVADCLCDLMYLLDVALVKPRLMYLHEGFWVSDIRETRNNYRKKLQCKVRLGKWLIYLLYVIHTNACACGYIADDDNKSISYPHCLYFATKHMISSGKNSKTNSMPSVIVFLISLIGKIVFVFIVSHIRDIIHTATRSQTEHRNTVQRCTNYLKRLNVPKATMSKVTEWFAYRWKQQHLYDDSRILNWLPSNMKRDMALAVHMGTLSKVQLFRDCSASLLRDLVLQLRPVSFLPGDVVVRRGDVGHLMYIIKSGECCVLGPDERRVLATLHEGCVFGEISLLGIEGARRRTATVLSRGYSHLFALSKSDLDQALVHHREAKYLLRRRADQIIFNNEQISMFPKISYLSGMKKSGPLLRRIPEKKNRIE